MRLWRRNVPADPAADHRQQDAEAAAAELQQPDAPAAEADDVAPPPPRRDHKPIGRGRACGAPLLVAAQPCPAAGCGT